MNLFLKPGKYEFVNIGRNKSNFEAFIKDEEDFYRHLSGHLMSQDISFSYDEDTNDGDIFVGAFRLVGKFKKVE